MRSLVLVLAALSLVACGGGDDDGTAGGTAGAAGSGTAGSGTAGSGTAGSGTAGTGTSGSSTAGAPAATCDPKSLPHVGEATFYAADGSGNCGFPATPGDPLVAAMNHPDYAGSAPCGACVHLQGPNGAITVRVVDQCPECKPGDLDLSQAAFAMIAPVEKGRVDIAWDYVPCPVTGNVVYHFKDGSNPYWTAIQIRNHRRAIAKVEAQKNGAWVSLARTDYNYFLDEKGLGPGPYAVRVTDTSGNVVEDTGVPSLDDADHPGTGQFPGCM